MLLRPTGDQSVNIIGNAFVAYQTPIRVGFSLGAFLQIAGKLLSQYCPNSAMRDA
jgi:hypothetical protein